MAFQKLLLVPGFCRLLPDQEVGKHSSSVCHQGHEAQWLWFPLGHFTAALSAAQGCVEYHTGSCSWLWGQGLLQPQAEPLRLPTHFSQPEQYSPCPNGTPDTLQCHPSRGTALAARCPASVLPANRTLTRAKVSGPGPW